MAFPRTMARHGIAPWPRLAMVLCGLAAIPLAGCKDERNAYVPPPPPKVTVATPVELRVPIYLETTGTVAPVNQVGLVARVPGFLQQIGYRDGEMVQQGRVLFVIEPQPYQASLTQAQGSLVAAQAELLNAETEFGRQRTLVAQDVSDQARYDDALARRDEARGKVLQAQGQLEQAQINLGYTQVTAPFPGPVTAHTTSEGQYVGGTTPTTLATILQTDPIWVKFNVSELANLRIRQELLASGITEVQLDQVVVEVGLAGRSDFPIAGRLDYLAPNVDTGTGTQATRAVFANPHRILLPGFFVRVRVRIPEGPNRAPSLLVPETALGADQSGRYVLVVNAEKVVVQRNVTLGERFGPMRVIETGLRREDRVVVNGLQRAIPGGRVEPAVEVLTPPDIPQPVPAATQPVAAAARDGPAQPAAAADPAPAAPQPAPATPGPRTATGQNPGHAAPPHGT
ncbi:MAG TPA: efflux RND transporter periplasmic adaptor subunit, partial [Crenalkalicoccus sp.]|nr:efflux RND transporter periplasmic adaptor subunit [Crenalkalicoccus sp.]